MLRLRVTSFPRMYSVMGNLPWTYLEGKMLVSVDSIHSERCALNFLGEVTWDSAGSLKPAKC